MDEADQILIDTLISIGLDISNEGVSLEQFTPDIIISATSLCLEIIFENKNQPQSFPKSCPLNMAARYKVGQILSEALKSIGYREPIGYQSFLYPNSRESRTIISFLIEKLPKDVGLAVDDGGNESARLNQRIRQIFGDNSLLPWLPYYCRYDEDFKSSRNFPKILLIENEEAHRNSFNTFPCLNSQADNAGELLASIIDYENKSRIIEHVDINRLQRQLIALEKTEKKSNLEQFINVAPPKIKKRTKFLEVEKEKSEENNQQDCVLRDLEENLKKTEKNYEEDLLKYENNLKTLQSMNEKYKSIKLRRNSLINEIEVQKKEAAIKEKTGIVLMHGNESVEKLEAAILKKERQLENIEKQWNEHREILEEKVKYVQQAQLEKFSKTRELEKSLKLVKEDMECCRKDYQEKDGQIKVLEERVKQIMTNSALQTKQNRNEFTKRILELTENKKKQNSEIRKILADIFLLQKEINNLRGKLERSFVETNDCIFANAKKDEMSKRMYKVVINIHENCQSLVNVIEERGKLLREIRDLEMSVEIENRENVERNLEKITKDYEEAKSNCEKLKKRILIYRESIRD